MASDGPNDICRVAYKTVLNDRISFAEVKFEKENWSLPKEIDLYEDRDGYNFTPGENITLAVDPVDNTKV